MRKVTICLVVLGVLAFAFISMPMRAQNQLGFPYGPYPTEFAPSRTSRAVPSPPPRVPPNKFNRATQPVSNEYIVALKDDTPATSVSIVATALARGYGGTIKYTWPSLKAFSVRGMAEAVAIALSNDPNVLYVEENGTASLFDNSLTPWGLDRITHLTYPPGTFIDPVTATTGNALSLANDGSGVNVYIIDTGIRLSHHQFLKNDGTSRVLVAVDETGGDGSDCEGHGTLTASIVGGKSFYANETSYGVARGATLRNVKAISGGVNCTSYSDDMIIAAMDWVRTNAVKPAVANISLGCGTGPGTWNTMCNTAADLLTATGVTVVAAAGNDGMSLTNDPVTPATAETVITAGATRSNDGMYGPSNYGRRIDVFAPGNYIPGASTCVRNHTYPPANPSDPTPCLTPTQTTDSDYRITAGTSVSAPYVAGAVALYLHDHTTGTASLPAVVRQVIKSNANICPYDFSTCGRVREIPADGSDTPKRLEFAASLPTSANPIYNQRFFVWQQYQDFVPKNSQTGQPQPEPDEVGLDYWTRQITQTCSGASADNNIAGVNLNSDCTVGGSTSWPNGKRVDVSLAFWVDPTGNHASWFDANNSYALLVPNATFVSECYNIYLKRPGLTYNNDDGVRYWTDELTANYGNPANAAGVNHLIRAFLTSWDYELRFGPHS